MDLTRRNFLKLFGTVWAVGGLGGINGLLLRLTPARARAATRPESYPGPEQAVNYRAIRQPGHWLG